MQKIFIDEIMAEYNAESQGWDFSYVSGCMIESILHWNFQQIAEKTLLAGMFFLIW